MYSSDDSIEKEKLLGNDEPYEPLQLNYNDTDDEIIVIDAESNDPNKYLQPRSGDILGEMVDEESQLKT